MLENLKLAAANADQWLEERGFKCQQRNGQRETINKNLAKLPQDIRENEVFIGKLPRTLFEDELLPFMQRAGTVYKMRLMMDFGMTNRGYAFARYTTVEEAINATIILKDQRIRPDEPPLGVCASFDNKRLFFGNLPDMKEAELFKKLSEKIDNIVSVKLHNKQGGHSDKRYAFVEFASHTDATAARRLLLPGTIKICGRGVTVDWAKADNPSSNPSQNNHSNNIKPLAHRNFFNNNNIIANNINNNTRKMISANKQQFNNNIITPIGGSRSSSTNSTLSSGISSCQNQHPSSSSNDFKADWVTLNNQSSLQNYQHHINPIGYPAEHKNPLDINDNQSGFIDYNNHYKDNLIASTQHMCGKNMSLQLNLNDINGLSDRRQSTCNHMNNNIGDALPLNLCEFPDVFTPKLELRMDSIDGAGDSVLGHKTKEMLQMVSKNSTINYNPLIDVGSLYNQPMNGFGCGQESIHINSIANNNNINNNIYTGENIVVIDNINVNVASMDKLKDLFELNKRIKINSLYRSGATSLTIIYERPEDAELMVETLTYIPTSFLRLSINQQLLQARRLVA